MSQSKELKRAEGGTRTRTPFRALPPQDSVSTSSTTSAGNKNLKCEGRKNNTRIIDENLSEICPNAWGVDAGGVVLPVHPDPDSR